MHNIIWSWYDVIYYRWSIKIFICDIIYPNMYIVLLVFIFFFYQKTIFYTVLDPKDMYVFLKTYFILNANLRLAFHYFSNVPTYDINKIPGNRLNTNRLISHVYISIILWMIIIYYILKTMYRFALLWIFRIIFNISFKILYYDYKWQTTMGR